MRFLALLIVAMLLPLPAFALDTEALGVVTSGSAAGKARIALLESQLATMTIKSTHPRIHLTDELIARGRTRVAAGHTSWAAIQANAAEISTGQELACAAFAYVMLAVSDPTAAATYAQSVYNYIAAQPDPTPWTASYGKGSTGTTSTAGWWALAYDWTYNGLTTEQRTALENKIATAANVSGRAAWVRGGGRTEGDSFHREMWVFYSYRAWPEIALAGHVTDADFLYKTRWRYDWIWGDAIRTWAYLNDGSNTEGYQMGAEGIAWFNTLYAATGVDILNSSEIDYGAKVADYVLYNIDFGMGRKVMHFGVNGARSNIWSWSADPAGQWKVRTHTCGAVQMNAHANPYHQWVLQDLMGYSTRCPTHWALTEATQMSAPDETSAIVKLLYYDALAPVTDPKTATYQQLPYGKLFAGAGEMNSRTSWGANAARMVQRFRPAWTRASHTDYSVGEFVLYRKGNLAPDSGMYDTLTNQYNYFGYQKNTVAHNTILLVDQTAPTLPWRSGSKPSDPGGINFVNSLDLGSNAEAFLHRAVADQGQVLSFATTPDYDLITGNMAKAYGDGTPDPAGSGPNFVMNRTSEATRTTMFLRSGGDKAYVLVLDRINANLGSGNFKKKWLIHATAEPTVSGSVTGTEVAGHVLSYDGNTWSAPNVQGTAAMYGKVLLPASTIRKVGGAGYEFWVDGATQNAATSGSNYTVDWSVYRTNFELLTGGPMEEIGTWRLEVIPNAQPQRDVLLNAIYMGDVGETLADTSLITTNVADRTGVFIKHSSVNNYAVFFNKAKYKTVMNDTFTFNVSPSAANTSVKFIITEVAPTTSYTIIKDGQVVSSNTASTDEGILEFTNSSATGSWSIVSGADAPPIYTGKAGGSFRGTVR